MKKVKVGVLGATGMVGQRFVGLLTNHPWFELTELAASEKSAGKKYSEVCNWKVDDIIPEQARELVVKECKPNLDCSIVFSALDSNVAGPIEEEFAKSGYVVVSNSKNHRMDMDVPLLVPEVNFEHLDILHTQKTKGKIVTNPNCCAIPLCIALKPLERFGVEKVIVTTMQALSGAGYPGVASLDIIDNVFPYIKDEEEKLESEPLKILGTFDGKSFVDSDMKISAHCNRVNTKDGHFETVSVKLRERVSPGEIIQAWRSFNPLREFDLPSAPHPPIQYFEQADRPQPRIDRDFKKGMGISIGRLRECNVLDFRFVVLGHNTIRGAAGAAILNAELMKVKGFVG